MVNIDNSPRAVGDVAQSSGDNVRNDSVSSEHRYSRYLSMSRALPRTKRSNHPSQTGRIQSITFTSPKQLKLCITEGCRICPRRFTGMNAKKQRALALEIKRSRVISLLSCVGKF